MSYGNFMFNLLKNNQTVFSTKAVLFYIPPAMCQGSNYATSWPTHFPFKKNYCHSSGISCGFSLHFPSD